MDCGANPQPASCCYIGTGIVYVCDWLAWQGSVGSSANQPFILPTAGGQSAAPVPFQISAAMRDIGECARLDLDVRSRIERLGRFDGCGGEQCATENLEAIDLTLSMECLSPSNLQLAFRGERTDPANPPTGQRIIRLAQAIRCASRPMAVLFVGVNAVDGTSLIVFLPKVKFQMARNRRFITDGFGDIMLTGALLHAGQVAAGHSPWWDETRIACIGEDALSPGDPGGAGGGTSAPTPPQATITAIETNFQPPLATIAAIETNF